MRKVEGLCWAVGLCLVVPTLAACGKDDGSRDSAADGSGGTGIPLDGGLEGDDGAEGMLDDDGGDGAEKLDVGSDATGGLEGCGGDAGNSGGGMGMDGEGDLEFSYIWIANSVESTISKIDTRTLVEEGRYITRPDSQGSPSRTSVNLSGDVGVANRSGGVTKVIAIPENCPDKNGNGVVDTAMGAAFLPWDQDECVAWHTPMAYQSQRPVAWAPGEWNPVTCQYDKQELWSAGSPGMGQAGGADVMLFDGDTGAIVNSVFVSEVNWDGYGIYGGAVDGEGNFWGTQLSGQILVYVNRETFAYKTWPVPISSYGMTVDSQGFVWACAYDVARFDPATELWQTAMGVGGSGGCMEDGNGTLWLAATPMIGVDTTTMAVSKMINVPEYVHGVSIDFDGFVWGVALQTPNAYKGDPATGMVQTFTGLNGPYSYSDMTGFALKNAGTIPPPAG